MEEVTFHDSKPPPGASLLKAPAKLKLLIVDDHRIVREGLKRIVEDQSDIQVAGEAYESCGALGLLRSHAFDAVVLDINLPGRSGMELLKIIRAEWSALPILVLSASPEEQYAVRALRDGASGYLTKDCASENLVTAIRKVVGGGKYISPALGERLANHYAAGARSAQEALTERETEVLKLIAWGKSTRQIAEALHLSPKTVGTYRARIQEKTGIRSNAQLTRYALELGLVS